MAAFCQPCIIINEDTIRYSTIGLQHLVVHDIGKIESLICSALNP